MARRTDGIGSSIGPLAEPLGGRLTSAGPSAPPKLPKPSKRPIIADIYERWTLDCIIEVAQAIATDFVNRPRQYHAVQPKISEILQNFRFLTSTNPDFPNRVQRSITFSAALGPSDGMDICVASMDAVSGMNGSTEGSQFKFDGARVRETARAYTERQVTQGEGELLQAFLDEADTLKGYLSTLDNTNNVVAIGDAQTRAIFGYAVQVLHDIPVAAVFGRPPAPAAPWPLGGNLNDDGARLIEEVAKALPAVLKPITQSKFKVMQRIANHGALTISKISKESFATNGAGSLASRKKRFEPLIGSAYSWKTALDALASS